MESKFTKIGSYQYSSEAAIVKGRLEAEEIEVFMADNFTIDTDPLVSNAIGGVKLYVNTSQVPEAANILEQISRYSLDDKGNFIECPECGGDRTELFTTVKNKKSLLAFIFGAALLGTLPFYTKYMYRCSNCNHEFE